MYLIIYLYNQPLVPDYSQSDYFLVSKWCHVSLENKTFVIAGVEL